MCMLRAFITCGQVHGNRLCVRAEGCFSTDQLDVNEWFIALTICSTCFGHLYAHHQELYTMCVLFLPVVCNALVAGGRRSGAGQQAMRLG